MEGFVEWFISQGGILDRTTMALQDIPNQGRGAIALKDLPEDHTLFSIPRILTLSTRTCDLPRLIGEETWKRSQLNKGWSGVILCMMWEESRGDNSKWSAYLRELPTTFDTPSFWSEDDLKELQGCALVDKLGKQEAENDYTAKIIPLLQARADLFDQSLLTTTYSLHNYHVMGSRLLSRSFQVEKWEGGDGDEGNTSAVMEAEKDESLIVAEPHSDGMVVDSNGETNHPEEDEDEENSDEEDDEDSSDVAMVPMADMLNARYESENAKLFHEATYLKMVTTKAIKAGEQIYNTYGDLPNSDLLRRYGHVDLVEIPDSNGMMGDPGDVVEVPADLISSVVGTDPEQLKERIEWWLDEGGDDVFVLDRSAPVPDVLVSFSKLLLLSEDDWGKAQSKGKPPKPKLDDVRTISLISEALRKRLGHYPTSLEDDEGLLKESGNCSLNLKNALVVRVGEKRILKAAIEHLSRVKLTLKSLEGPEGGSSGMKRKRVSNEGKQARKERR
ncbi:SET domain-containing protein [Schizopora paradoxa]|uniref:Ribosomal lysine N-methyltransferase 4 n=1 Tax=Schizopora paradoxa TaxID=27342 RepID=A0A0H2RHV6_9AGAM|nr:SET domain-containing protein [Schizopora paradoxa]